MLTDAEQVEVKKIARKLLSHIEGKLVLDWCKKAQTRETARLLVKDILDELAEAYDPETFDRNCELVFNHIFASYFDDGWSVYDEDASDEQARAPVTEPGAVAMRTRTRIEDVDGAEICRVDVARSSVPVRAKMSDKDDVFWVRMNNTTREWPEEAVDEYLRDHWGAS